MCPVLDGVELGVIFVYFGRPGIEVLSSSAPLSLDSQCAMVAAAAALLDVECWHPDRRTQFLPGEGSVAAVAEGAQVVARVAVPASSCSGSAVSTGRARGSNFATFSGRISKVTVYLTH